MKIDPQFVGLVEDVAARVNRDLVAQIDRLEDAIHNLKLALQLDRVAQVQVAFKATETMAQLLILLSDGKPHNKEKLHAGLYFSRPADDSPDVKILDTQICKLRKHMAKFGVRIRTIHQTGYQLTAGLEIVRSAIEGDRAEQARQRKRQRERERQRRIRAQRGCRDRQTILEQSLARQKPWEAAGVSRATWYRRHRETNSLLANDNSPVSAPITESKRAA